LNIFSFTKSKETGKGTDNYVVKARLEKHVPEILPIAGKRLYISYPGQLRQCRKCFEQGHQSAACTKTKVDWLDYVLMLMNSGSFKKELFDGWKPALDQYRPDPMTTGDLRNVINFNKAQNQGQTQPQGPQPSSQGPQQPPQPPQGQGPSQPPQQPPQQPPINPWGQSPWQNNTYPWQNQWNPSNTWQGQAQGQNWQGWQNSRGRGRGRGRGRATTSQRNFGPNY